MTTTIVQRSSNKNDQCFIYKVRAWKFWKCDGNTTTKHHHNRHDDDDDDNIDHHQIHNNKAIKSDDGSNAYASTDCSRSSTSTHYQHHHLHSAGSTDTDTYSVGCYSSHDDGLFAHGDALPLSLEHQSPFKRALIKQGETTQSHINTNPFLYSTLGPKHPYTNHTGKKMNSFRLTTCVACFGLRSGTSSHSITKQQQQQHRRRRRFISFRPLYSKTKKPGKGKTTTPRSTLTSTRSRIPSFYTAISGIGEDDGSGDYFGNYSMVAGCSPARTSHTTRLFRCSSSIQKFPTRTKSMTRLCSRIRGFDDDDFFSAIDGDSPPQISLCSTNMLAVTDLPKAIAHEDEKLVGTMVMCACNHPAHRSVYHSMMPLFTGPHIISNSYEERLAIATACCGYWITILDRSESLDTQYRVLGLGMVKRAVMNRISIPLTMFLEENDTILHCWIHTPIGIRHMRSNLLGLPSVDEDPDAGTWTGYTSVVDYSIPWFCNGTPVRALQQVRVNPKCGTCIETRCILPDPKEGKIMLFNFVMLPKGKEASEKLSADRVLRYAATEPSDS